MSGTINTGSVTKALWPGVRAWFGMDYKEHKQEWAEIFEKRTSDKHREEMVALAGFGLAPIKPEGDGISYDSMSQFYTSVFYPVVVGLGFQITKEAISDNQYPELTRVRSKNLSFVMRQTKEIMGANVLNRAFTSGYTGGDGKVLCATDHPTKSGTYSNKLSTAADLSGASLEQAFIDIAGLVDHADNKIHIEPKKLFVERNNMFEAQRILKSAKEYDTSNNAINPINGMVSIHVNHYLTDADAWFVKTDCQEGLVCFQRWPLELAPAENDFDTENAKFKATERYVFGWGDPKTVFASEGA